MSGIDEVLEDFDMFATPIHDGPSIGSGLTQGAPRRSSGSWARPSRTPNFRKGVRSRVASLQGERPHWCPNHRWRRHQGRECRSCQRGSAASNQSGRGRPPRHSLSPKHSGGRDWSWARPLKCEQHVKVGVQGSGFAWLVV